MSARVAGPIATVPNALSLLRLAGVPLFYWLIVGPQSDGAAILVLAISGFTDWLDGYLARRLGQFSRLGELLDPLADRLYTLAALAALWQRGIAPTIVVVVLLARDALLTGVVAWLRRRGVTGLPVNFAGKAATMTLLYTMPLLLLGTFPNDVGRLAHAFGWAFAWWSIVLYWYSALLYLRQVRMWSRGAS
mgnify:CR=1 FL=1